MFSLPAITPKPRRRVSAPGGSPRTHSCFSQSPIENQSPDSVSGIDIGAKAEIYELINRMTEKGMAVVVSSEPQELPGIRDRIAVIGFGGKSGEFERDNFDPDRIMKASTIITA